MILADTSIWVDHLARGDDVMKALLESNSILMHPFVVGEIALGRLPRRAETLSSLVKMQMAVVADPGEVLVFIQRNDIFGSGVGYVDAHLLVATTLTPEARLWTRDRKLQAVAARLSINAHVE